MTAILRSSLINTFYKALFCHFSSAEQGKVKALIQLYFWKGKISGYNHYLWWVCWDETILYLKEGFPLLSLCTCLGWQICFNMLLGENLYVVLIMLTAEL